MQNNYSEYNQNQENIPSFGQQPAYAFDALDLELYHELSEISEEIGKCRLEHLR